MAPGDVRPWHTMQGRRWRATDEIRYRRFEMRVALSILMALHGVAHLVGFAGSWRLMKDAPATTTLLGGRFDIGEKGLRPYGILWLVAAALFLIAAVAVATDQDWWIPVTGAVSLFSLLLCILSWPLSRIGVFINLAILGIVLAWSL